MLSFFNLKLSKLIFLLFCEKKKFDFSNEINRIYVCDYSFIGVVFVINSFFIKEVCSFIFVFIRSIAKSRKCM